MTIKRRKKKLKGANGRPRNVGNIPGSPVGASHPSLPPDVVAAALDLSPSTQLEDTRVKCPKCGTLTKLISCPSCSGPVEQPSWRSPDDSIIRTHAVRIIALRLGGMADDDIAKLLKINRSCISPYLWRAGKNGWLDFSSSREAIEYGLMHKVLRNLDEGLEDVHRNEKTGVQVKTAVAMKMAEGTIFKDFDKGGTGEAAPMVAISLRIEQPTTPTEIREGTIGQVPNYIEAEVV